MKISGNSLWLFVTFVGKVVFLQFILVPRSLSMATAFSVSTYIAVFGLSLIFQAEGDIDKNYFISAIYEKLTVSGTVDAL